MRTIATLLTGLFTALVSLIIVTGALSLALSEGFPTVPLITVVPATATAATIEQTPSFPETPAPPMPTIAPSATSLPATTCPVPSGWYEVVLQPGDNLADLAATHGISSETIAQANCLLVDQLLPGSIIFLPPATPTLAPPVAPTQVIIPCGPPYGWVRYIVQPGDTLFKLSLVLHVSVVQLQWANCLGGSTLIRAGDVLYTPFIPPPPPPVPTQITPGTTETQGTETEAPDIVTDTPDPDATVEPTEEETLPPEETEPPAETEPPQETEPPDVIFPTDDAQPPEEPGQGI